MSALISTEDLERRLGESSLRILDASWHMPSEKRDARKEFLKGHIPGAFFFDIDAICDRNSPYPHMLPSAEDFARDVSALGIGNGSDVIIYDSSGLFSSARVWWMFRIFGHDKVWVLNGGLPKWKAEGRKLEPGMPTAAQAVFHPAFNPLLLRDKKRVEANITRPLELLFDARSPGRFAGSEPEPRPGLKSGHIEGSINLFFRDCLMPPYNTLKTPEELRALFSARGVDSVQQIAVTCGSGVTACILALALFEIGNRIVAIYDGAWAEWGTANTPR